MVIYATWESSTDREDFDLLQTFPMKMKALNVVLLSDELLDGRFHIPKNSNCMASIT